MFKNHRKIMIILNVIVLIVVLVKTPGANTTYKTPIFVSTTYKIPRDLCYLIFSTSPERLLENLWGSDADGNAYIDDEGNLIATFDKSRKEWCLSCGGGAMDEAKDLGIKISDDYKIYTIECYGDEIDYIRSNLPARLLKDIAMHQFVFNYDPDSYSITCRVIDAANGNLIYEGTIPNGMIIYSTDTIGKDKFSARP